MLVKLYELPPLEAVIADQAVDGIAVRRVLPPEKEIVTRWVSEQFNTHWMSECAVAFTRTPPTCFVAVENGQVIGFSCYDATAKGFFGPIGVSEAARSKGAGKALLLACLHAMLWDGYFYAIIGGAGPTEFYEKAVNAKAIPGSEPGIFGRLLR